MKVAKASNNTANLPWNHVVWYKFKDFFFCCFKQEPETIEIIEKADNPVSIVDISRLSKISKGDL